MLSYIVIRFLHVEENSSFVFEKLDLPSDVPVPDGWNENEHNPTSFDNRCPIDKFNEEEESNFGSASNPNSDFNSDFVDDLNPDSDFKEFIQATKTAVEKWAQIKFIQVSNIEKVVFMLNEIISFDYTISPEFHVFNSMWRNTFSLFINNLEILLKYLNDSYSYVSGICDVDYYNYLQDIESSSVVIEENDHSQNITENDQLPNIEEDESDFSKINNSFEELKTIIKVETFEHVSLTPFLEEIINVSTTCGQLFDDYNVQISSLELNFTQSYSKKNLFVLNKFNQDDKIISINETIERYTNGLINLKNSIINIFRDITNIANGDLNADKYLWLDSTQIVSSSSSSIITHYVVRNLGKLLDPTEVNTLSRRFHEWKPGKTSDAVEKEIFEMYKNDPVEYWTEMLQEDKWRYLAQIALRIISIPPTEGACERVFSARREIMTKHISNINDSVVEARSVFKAGFYHPENKKMTGL